jgi:hypothetical protein
VSTSGNRSIGTWVLVVGWMVVIAGGVVIVLALGDHDRGRDERAGVGFALLMTGMLIVLAGNYIHHRALVDDAEPELSRRAGSDSSVAPTDDPAAGPAARPTDRP